MRILTFTSLFPNGTEPNKAVFIKHRMAAVNRFCDAEVRVVAPVPYFPNLPVAGKWQRFSRIPKRELVDGLEVVHPRYLVTPKLGMSLYGISMFLGSIGAVRRLQQGFPFDLIDAHYVYPDGLAAVLLGKLFQKPVVLSARGTDVNLYPQFPLIRPLVRMALRDSNRLISVCGSLKEIMVEVGADPGRIDVIPNGIDPELFYKLEQGCARARLGLDPNDKILLSVGALIERKGMHLLLDALAILKRKGELIFKTFLIGEGDYRGKLEAIIARNNLQDQVKLIGEVANSHLAAWYNAADIFFLGSSREGWPNVVSEALACGTPVIATDVHGIPEIVVSDQLGLIVKRSVEDFATALEKGFTRRWDRDHIGAHGQQRTWEIVAREVYGSFLSCMAGAKPAKRATDAALC